MDNFNIIENIWSDLIELGVNIDYRLQVIDFWTWFSTKYLESEYVQEYNKGDLKMLKKAWDLYLKESGEIY